MKNFGLKTADLEAGLPVKNVKGKSKGANIPVTGEKSNVP
jgi:hypothetical protein